MSEHKTVWWGEVNDGKHLIFLPGIMFCHLYTICEVQGALEGWTGGKLAN